jgi:hypothetical protein
MQYLQMMQDPAMGTDGQLAVKTDMLVDYIGDKLGVPAAVRNNAAERAILIEEAQSKQAVMAQAQANMMTGGMPPSAPGMAPQGSM